MKKLILIISLFFALNIISPPAKSQSGKPSEGFVITLMAENAGKDWVYLSRKLNGSMINIDSTELAGYPVVLTGKQDVPEMLFLRITGSNTLIPVFTENSEITVFADFNKPELTRVQGSEVHKQYDSYVKGLGPISIVQDSLTKEYRSALKLKDTDRLSFLDKKLEELDKTESDYTRNFVLQNRGSFVSPYVIRRSLFYTLELNELKTIVASLDGSISKSSYYIDLKDKISVLEKVDVGRKYTDINLPARDGKIINLSDFVGKNVILVDFWASWCGPCRRENPNVVKLYNEYHNKGFDIVGVSFDTDGKAWEKAIKSDSLVWNHMSDLKGWNSKAAELYGVASIPHTILIGKDGTIIAKNLHAEELREKLAELLK